MLAESDVNPSIIPADTSAVHPFSRLLRNSSHLHPLHHPMDADDATPQGQCLIHQLSRVLLLFVVFFFFKEA